MDRVFSTRMDENLVKKVNRMAKQKSISKKALIEDALQAYLKESGSNIELDIIERSFGAWKRDEAFEQTWTNGRKTFNAGFKRHFAQKENK